MNPPNLIIFGDPLFEGITNKTFTDDNGTPFIQIKHHGVLYRVRIASTEEDLRQVKQLDDQAFGKHQGVSIEELKKVSGVGKVLTLTNEAGILVAQSQILTSPIPEHPQMAVDEAYCYGTSVKTGEEGKGYAQVLFKAQEVVAREAGRQRMTLTVRVENARSIRARLQAGFRIVGYDSKRYGPREYGGARLIMEKKLTAEPLPFDALKQAERVKAQLTPRLSLSNQKVWLTRQPIELAIPVSIGDEVDTSAHHLIEKALFSGYIGTGLLKPDEYDGGSSKQSLSIFQRKDSVPFVEHVSLPIQLHSEFGRLREVVIAYPPEAAVIKPGNAINKVAQSNIGNIDAIAFKEEHEAFLETLKSLGINIIHTSSFPPDGKTPIFTRDPAFVLGDTFVIGKFAVEMRQYEMEGLKRLSRDMKTVEIGDDERAVLEGGDVIIIGEKIVAVGLGQRTNKEGARKLAETFPDYHFIGVRHTDLHLDVLFTVTGEKRVLADIAELPPEFIDFLKERGYQIIEADHWEQKRLGCNVLAVDNNKVIAVAENSITNQRLRANGVEVIEVSMPNVIKKGGGPRCLTCPTRRE